MVDPGLFRDRSHERRNGRDRQDRDRDERQAEPKLDEPQAVAAVEDRISRGIVRRLFGVHATSEAWVHHAFRPERAIKTPTRSSLADRDPRAGEP